jgi:aspartyl-tRNA(Asn)/glutamyl-tRNA(Gln) amidotransferase subunit C
MTDELNGILKWIDMLSQVNTDGIEPMASVVDMPMIMRTDIVNDGNVAEKVLANAPLAEYDCFAVPKVIE